MITLKSICKEYIEEYDRLLEESNVVDFYWYDEVIGTLIYNLNKKYFNYTFVSSGPLGLFPIAWIDAYDSNGTRVGSIALSPISIDNGQFTWSNRIKSTSNRVTGKSLPFKPVPPNAGLSWVFKNMKEFSYE